MFKFLILFLLTINVFANNDINLNKFFNKNSCDKIINKGTYNICYDYKARGPKYVAYTLYGDKVNQTNIKKRPSFYTEKTIKKQFRTTNSDYSYTGYNRGHINNDAANDYNQKALNKVYTLANIIPQSPMVNQKTWSKVERYARSLAVKYGEIKVLNIINYKNSTKFLRKISLEDAMKFDKARNPKKFKEWSRNKKNKYRKSQIKLLKKRILIPTSFVKILYTKDKMYCFLYSNELNVDWKNDKLSSHKVPCNNYLK